MSKYTWEYLGRPEKGGHRFWRDAQSGQIAIADDSGDGMHGHAGRPDETDDGVLFLDVDMIPEMYVSSIGGIYVSLPLVRPEGTDPHCYTGVSAKAFLWLVKEGHWTRRDMRLDRELKEEVAELLVIMNLLEKRDAKTADPQ